MQTFSVDNSKLSTKTHLNTLKSDFMQCLLAQGASNTLCLKNVMIYFLNKTKEIEPHLYLYIPYTHKINKYDNTKTMGK